MIFDIELWQVGIFVGGFFAGVIDTVAGGGGLITVPLLLYAGLSPAVAMGTDKLQAGFGEFSASLKLLQSKALDLKKMGRYVLFTIIGSTLGSTLMIFLPADIFTKMLPFFMIAILVFSFLKKDLQKRHQAFFAAAAVLGLGVGFYNGFFGPGTGAIWTAGLVYFGGLSIKEAAIYGKPYNFIGNLVSISFFVGLGKVDYSIAAIMGVGCSLGALVGARILLSSAQSVILVFFRVSVVVTTLSMFYKYYIAAL